MARTIYSFVLVLLFTSTAFAGLVTVQVGRTVDELKQSNAPFTMMNGEKIQLNLSGKPADAPHDGVFLGRVVLQDYTNTDLSFYDFDTKTIHYVPFKDVQMWDKNKVRLENDDTFPLTKSEEQEGSTCMAYTLYNSMRQVDYVSKGERKLLHENLSTESQRQRFIVSMVNEYYVESNGYDKKVLMHLADTYGVHISRVEKRKVGIPATRTAIEKSLKRFDPVLITFEVPMNMYTAPYEIFLHGKSVFEDRRIWTPKKAENKGYGGHAVLAVGLFEDPNGERWMIMVDPNWTYPRLWNWNELEKIEGGEVEAWVLDAE